jgi:hypothetical protein
MRILFLSLLIVLAFIFNKSAAQTYSFENPVDYNNHIVARQDSVLEKSIYYSIQTAHSEDENANEAMRLEVIRQIDQSVAELKNTATYKNDARLRDESIDVLTLYKEAFGSDFQEVTLLKKNSLGSFEVLEKYFRALDKAENKLNQASKKFAKAQLDFASKYNLSIEQGPMHDALDVITHVNQYSRALFLEQFKVSKVNAVFLEGLNAQKASGLEGKRKDLLNTCVTALASVNNLSAYKGEHNFRNATIKLIEYYKILAEKQYAEMENIMKNPKPTDEDIKNFNQMVVKMNEESASLVLDFNKANREFMRENIPYE